jgi:hypothetical protein
MKKLVLLLFVVVFTLIQLAAQDPTFNKGDKVINFGLGLGSIYYSGIGYKIQVPPVSASFEVGVVDNILEKGVIGVGGYIGFSSYKYADDWRTSNLVIGARGNFHYPLVNKLDTYAGLGIGYRIVSYSDLNGYSGIHSGSASNIIPSLFIGARYYFSDNIAVMGEFGYMVSYLSLGIALKF